jgi:hypothetical protein
MQFFNGITLPDLIDKEVDLFVTDNKGGKGASLLLCKAFLKKDRLWIDCVPSLNRRYTAAVPYESIVAREEGKLDTGRCGIFISPTSVLGQMVQSVMASAELARRDA